MITGIDHVQVAAPVGCEAETRTFYGGLLGLEEIAKPAALGARGGCWFRAGTHELHVGVADPFIPARKAHPAFRVESRARLQELAERLASAGTEVEWAADGEIPGIVRFHVYDPFGNRIELVA